jgi:hypothetical protein
MAKANITPNLYVVKDSKRSACIITFEPRNSAPIFQDLEADLKRLLVLLQQAGVLLKNCQGRWLALHESRKNLKRGA